MVRSLQKREYGDSEALSPKLKSLATKSEGKNSSLSLIGVFGTGLDLDFAKLGAKIGPENGLFCSGSIFSLLKKSFEILPGVKLGWVGQILGKKLPFFAEVNGDLNESSFCSPEVFFVGDLVSDSGLSFEKVERFGLFCITQ